MSWQIGWDANWMRDVGYGVPAYCDHPGCRAKIDRGLSYVCGNAPKGGEHGCGLYFCPKHMMEFQLCDRCYNGQPPFAAKPDHPEWMRWKLNDESWEQWRKENPAEVQAIRKALNQKDAQ